MKRIRPEDPSIFVVKKRLGQNFLVDRRVLSRIVEACDLSPEETVLEIGPGQGALTCVIMPCVRELIAVEADRQLVERLTGEFSGTNLRIVHADFLKFGLGDLPGPLKVVGNLPYYISTPIITKVLENRERFTSLFMTVQLEFGERLLAPVGSKQYSSFTCWVNYFAKPTMLFKIRPGAFRPVPKVESCFMRLDMRRDPAVPVRDELLFLRIIRTAFLQRRKTLANALGVVAPKDVLMEACRRADISPGLRPEDLSLEDYARLSDALTGGE
ncbi:MAG: ribosomal RNA small subunit methyltransferase A [Elusimicrobia bacterium]|nr:ribosomal RNA small subunit methyltransferase A [Elusimicrobiota bacterium]